LAHSPPLLTLAGSLNSGSAALIDGIPPRLSFNKPGRAARKQTGTEHSPVSGGQASPQPVPHRKPWRNAPCPCGSGKKFKKCCGKV